MVVSRKKKTPPEGGAMVAAKIANLVKGQTLRAGTSIGVPVSQPEAAQLLNVGERSVQRAKKAPLGGGASFRRLALSGHDHRAAITTRSPTIKATAINATPDLFAPSTAILRASMNTPQMNAAIKTPPATSIIMSLSADAAPSRFHASGALNTRPISTKWATISSLSSWDIGANTPSLGHRV